MERVQIENTEVYTHFEVTCPNEECDGLLNEEIEGDKTEDDFEEEIRCQYCQTVFIAFTGDSK